MPNQMPRRGFLVTEFESRLHRAQQLIHAQDIAALWLTTEPEVRYFTGFLTQFWQSSTRPWFLVVPSDGKPIAVIPEIGARLMATTWLDDIRTWPAPTPEDDGVSLLISTLRETAGRTGSIGTLMGPETHLRMPLGDYETLRKKLVTEGLNIIDATPIVRTLRLVKSAAEIEKIATICGLVSEAFVDLPNWVSPGESEREIFRRFKIDVLSRGADDIPYLVGGAGNAGYNNIISPPSNRPLQSGDLLMLDTGSVFDGYFCDFDRNYTVGTPSDAVRMAHNLLFQATEAGLKIARPGITTATLFHTMWRVLENWEQSGNSVGRFGHGLGMQLTEWPSIAPGDHIILQPGMVLTLEPGLQLSPGRMLVHEENIVIREDGAELLTERAPRELPVIA